MLKDVVERTKTDRIGRIFRRKIAVCLCDACGKTIEKSYCSTFPVDSLTFCNRNCLSHSRRSGLLGEKTRKTLLEKYGVINISQSAEIRETIRNNSLERYGVEHHTKSDNFKEKEKQSRLNKFGVKHHWMLDEVKEKRKCTWRQNYGVDNPGAADEIKERIKSTIQKRYNVDNAFAAEEIQEKIRNTLMDRYGVDHCSKHDAIHKKQVEGLVGMDYDYYYDTYLPAFKSYRRKVWAVTKKQPLESLDNYDKRSRGNCGYHIDHIVSVSDGFKNSVSPEVIGNIKNLRMLLGRENVSKGARSDMNISDLLEKTGAQNEVDN